MTASLSVSALLLALAAPLAQDDFVPCEADSNIGLARDGAHVWANFLGACGEVSDYDDALAFLVEEDDGWTVIGTHWEVAGTEEVEYDDELHTYRRFDQEVDCPSKGAHEFRVAWINRDGAEAWFGDRFDCTGGVSGCASLSGDPSVPAGLWLVGAALLALGRRRPDYQITIQGPCRR